MIKRISISNYALIDTTELELAPGFSIITGETGAGKSILLGALGLTLGQRAETAVLQDKQRKCIVEITYDVEAYGLQSWFLSNDLDYGNEVVVRREITIDGRSRGFINDTPVNNKLLKEFGSFLIDIHSQHQSLLLSQPEYQLLSLDAYSGLGKEVKRYQDKYKSYITLKNKIAALKQQIEQFNREREYVQFQYSRLEEAQLKEGEQIELETELSRLNNSETIKGALSAVVYGLRDKEESALQLIKESKQRMGNLSDTVKEAGEFEQRLDSVLIELRDIVDESERIGEEVVYDGARIAWIDDRLSTIYGLEQKYSVETEEQLIQTRDDFEMRLSKMEEGGEELETLSHELHQREIELLDYAKRLHDKRVVESVSFCQVMNNLLKELGIKHANFMVHVTELTHFTANGRDEVTFLFAANKNQEPGELSKVASGGEISRVMLSLKYILSKTNRLPVIVFDEIDTGVSGEVAHKMAMMMKEMSKQMQVLSISHLPQLAAMGDSHFKVFKDDNEERSVSRIRKLNSEERVQEIAAMISGTSITPAALETARNLLRISEV